MKLKIVLIAFFLVVVGCGHSEKSSKKEKELIIVEASEMSKLMNEMYAYSQSIKQQIINNNLVGSYPSKFDNIHSAVLTDPADRDLDFELMSKQFLKAQKSIYEASKDKLIIQYNNAINACVSCHSVKCVGPIL